MLLVELGPPRYTHIKGGRPHPQSARDCGLKVSHEGKLQVWTTWRPDTFLGGLAWTMCLAPLSKCTHWLHTVYVEMAHVWQDSVGIKVSYWIREVKEWVLYLTLVPLERTETLANSCQWGLGAYYDPGQVWTIGTYDKAWWQAIFNFIWRALLWLDCSCEVVGSGLFLPVIYSEMPGPTRLSPSNAQLPVPCQNPSQLTSPQVTTRLSIPSSPMLISISTQESVGRSQIFVPCNWLWLSIHLAAY